MAPIREIPKTGYVFGASSNPITSVRAGRIQTATPIQNPGRFAALERLNSSYGQSPRVADDAGVGKYFGDAQYGANVDYIC